MNYYNCLNYTFIDKSKGYYFIISNFDKYKNNELKLYLLLRQFYELEKWEKEDNLRIQSDLIKKFKELGIEFSENKIRYVIK